MTFLTSLDAEHHRRHKWRNRVHTWLLAGGSLLLLVLCAFILAGPDGILWALIGGGIGLFFATRMSPEVVLRMYRARPLPADVFRDGQRALALVAERAELPATPKLYYIPSRMMNAFAVGHAENAIIGVTDGLIRGLSLREFAAVMAHEVSHIRSGDIKVMALADVVARMTSVMSTFGMVVLALNLPAIIAGGNGVPWLAILILLFAPTIGGLLQLALSRAREYDADLDAASLTGDPEGLATALIKLEQAHGRMWEGLMLPGSRIPDPSLLRSHPRTEDRVARLRALRLVPDPAFTQLDAPVVIGHSFIPVTRKPRRRVTGVWY